MLSAVLLKGKQLNDKNNYSKNIFFYHFIPIVCSNFNFGVIFYKEHEETQNKLNVRG